VQMQFTKTQVSLQVMKVYLRLVVVCYILFGQVLQIVVVFHFEVIFCMEDIFC
jgi:hypothetical protein